VYYHPRYQQGAAKSRQACRLYAGLPASFTSDTCRVMTAMASLAMQQLPDGVPAASHAAVGKSLRRLSKALRAELKVPSGITHLLWALHRTAGVSH
jgi:hypothetical protein